MPNLVKDSLLTIELEKQQKTIDTASRWSIDADYLLSADAFSFELYSPNPADVRDLELQPVKLRVNGAEQCTGRIERSTTGENGSTAVFYEGRDYIADMVECAIEPTLSKLKEGVTLFDAITQLAGPVGIDTVLGDGDIPLRDIRTGKSIAGGAPQDFRPLKVEELKFDIGTGIYDACNRMVARHRATIQPTTKRNEVMVTSPDYSQSPAYGLRRTLASGSTNIINAVSTRDLGAFPTYALFTGDQSRAGTKNVPLATQIGISDVVAAKAQAIAGGSVNGLLGVALFAYADALESARQAQPTSRTVKVDTSKKFSLVDRVAGFSPQLADILRAACYTGRRKLGDPPLEDGALYRLIANRDTEARNAAQVEAAAVRAIGERLKDAQVYQVTVAGHVDPETGAVWTVDTIVDVHDEVANLFGPMWIAKRTLNYSDKTGATTDLTCWLPGAFVI